jgi:hypothetical protein
MFHSFQLTRVIASNRSGDSAVQMTRYFKLDPCLALDYADWTVPRGRSTVAQLLLRKSDLEIALVPADASLVYSGVTRFAEMPEILWLGAPVRSRDPGWGGGTTRSHWPNPARSIGDKGYSQGILTFEGEKRSLLFPQLQSCSRRWLIRVVNGPLGKREDISGGGIPVPFIMSSVPRNLDARG